MQKMDIGLQRMAYMGITKNGLYGDHKGWFIGGLQTDNQRFS